MFMVTSAYKYSQDSVKKLDSVEEMCEYARIEFEHFDAQQVIVDYRGCESVYDSYEEFQEDWEGE